MQTVPKMSTSDGAPVSALRRFKRSVSRIATKRKDAKYLPETSVSNEEGLAVREEAPQQTPTFDSWQVDPILETFSERLHDVLDVQTVVSKAQKSLKVAERVTVALKEQSAAALEIAKQDFCYSAKRDSDLSGTRESIDKDSYENQRILDALEGEIMCATLQSMEETITRLQKVQGDISLGLMSASASLSSDEQNNRTIRLLKKLDELRALLIHRLLAKRDQAVQDTEVFQIARLLGHLTTPRVELQCYLEHYSNIIRQQVSSDIVSLSVSSTVQFVREDGSLGTPSKLSSDIGFAMMSMMLDAHERSQELIERHSLPYLSHIFDSWAQQQVRETCEVLLRLVILPMAVPKGFPVVSQCISLFQNYCQAIEVGTKIHVQNMVVSVLKAPFLDMYMKFVEQQLSKVRNLPSDGDLNHFIKLGIDILRRMKSNEYILGHQRLSIARKIAEQYACCCTEAMCIGSNQTVNSRDTAADRDHLRDSVVQAILDEV